MTKATRVVQIGRWISKWKRRMLLDNWGVSILLEPAAKKESGDTHTVAAINIAPRYTDAKLHVYPPLWDECLEYQENTIVHELGHIITNKARLALFKYGCPKAELDDIIEEMTEHFTKAITKAYKRKSVNYKL